MMLTMFRLELIKNNMLNLLGILLLDLIKLMVILLKCQNL